MHTTFGERTNGARHRQKNYFKKVQLTSDLKFAQEPLHKCLHIWSESNGRSRACHFWLKSNQWRKKAQAKKFILKDAAMEGDFSLAKDPLLFQTEDEGHAAFGKRTNGACCR